MSKIRDLFVWQAQSRPKYSYSWEVFATLGAIALLTSVIFMFFQEWLAITVIWAAFFLFFALTRVQSTMVTHKITTEGLITFIDGSNTGKTYLWQDLGPFWFTLRGGETSLHISSKLFLEHIILMVNQEDIEIIRETLAEYLPFIEVPHKSVTDKLTDWFTSQMILEKDHHKKAS